MQERDREWGREIESEGEEYSRHVTCV